MSSAPREIGPPSRLTPASWRRLPAATPRWLRSTPWFALLLLAPVFVLGVFGPWISPHDASAIDLANTKLPPAWMPGGEWPHLLGTDSFGRDLLSTLIDGARVTLVVAVLGTMGTAAIGIAVGLVGGYYGGRIDAFLMQLADMKMSIPATLLIILLGSAIGAGLVTIVLSIVILYWAGFARVIRGQTLTLRERGYVALARVADCSDYWIITRHILPNVMPTCIVLITVQIGRAIVTEAGISFLGLGVQPPDNAWGLMVSQGRTLLATAWWIPVFPGLAITFTVLGANLFGDWMRDTLDSRASAL